MFSFDPLFDEVVMCTFSPASSSVTTPSPSVHPYPLPALSTLAAMPIPPSRTSPRNKNPDHIPRPRNAFMLFRSAFAAAQKITANIERDNRHITRIIAHCWNRLSDLEKQVWRDKAAAEKVQHAQRYPNYHFAPVGRTKKPKKRNVRRNGVEDVERCEKLAELVMAGTCGRDLEGVLSKIEQQHSPVGTELLMCASDEKTLLSQDLASSDVPPFLSPLLPPAKITPQQVPDNNVPIEPQISCSPNVKGASPQDDLGSLLQSPCYQYYLDQHDATSESSPRSIPPTHYQSLLAFAHSSQNALAEPEQSTDFDFFSWNQSDGFSYYN